MNRLLIAVGVLCAVALPAAYFTFEYGMTAGDLSFSQETRSAERGVSSIYLSLAMIAGVVLSAVQERLRQRKAPIAPRTFLLSTFSDPALWRALVASPIIFIGVYSIARTLPDPVVALLTAFQNGFFCESILKQRRAEITGEPLEA
jgi:hypothetical protein